MMLKQQPEADPNLVDNLTVICFITIISWFFMAGIAYAIHRGICVLLH